VDAVTFFQWNRAADVLAPLLMRSLGTGGSSSIVNVQTRAYQGSETFARHTELGLAVEVAYREGWMRVWRGTSRLSGEDSREALDKQSAVDLSFTAKGIRDMASLLYGYSDVGSQ